MLRGLAFIVNGAPFSSSREALPHSAMHNLANANSNRAAARRGLSFFSHVDCFPRSKMVQGLSSPVRVVLHRVGGEPLEDGDKTCRAWSGRSKGSTRCRHAQRGCGWSPHCRRCQRLQAVGSFGIDISPHRRRRRALRGGCVRAPHRGFSSSLAVELLTMSAPC